VADAVNSRPAAIASFENLFCFVMVLISFRILTGCDGRRVPIHLDLENCTLVPSTCTLVQVELAGLDEDQSGYRADFVKQDINAEGLAEKTYGTGI
jgi:hypothetical protein